MNCLECLKNLVEKTRRVSGAFSEFRVFEACPVLFYRSTQNILFRRGLSNKLYAFAMSSATKCFIYEFITESRAKNCYSRLEWEIGTDKTCTVVIDQRQWLVWEPGTLQISKGTVYIVSGHIPSEMICLIISELIDVLITLPLLRWLRFIQFMKAVFVPECLYSYRLVYLCRPFRNSPRRSPARSGCCPEWAAALARGRPCTGGWACSAPAPTSPCSHSTPQTAAAAVVADAAAAAMVASARHKHN